MIKQITLCADDYGQNQSISQGIIALLEKNRLSATSCMTSSPDWSAHAKWLQPFAEHADIGLHFNLTEGKPLSAKAGFLPLSQLILKAYACQLKESFIKAELNAQLDAFAAAMGRLPDFIDGHQHIHQLPVIRDVLMSVYEERLRTTNSYIRCLYEPYLSSTLKGAIIQLLGAKTFKKNLIQHRIPHNSSFAGIYSFAHSAHYSRIFPSFLAQIKEGGLIMCHAGLSSQNTEDRIAKTRYHEFVYLKSDDFVSDCFQAKVVLGRLFSNP